jgi:ribonuclease P protein component
MTEPGANVPDTAAGSAVTPSPVAPAFERLRQRPEFLRVAKGERFHSRAFSLQAAPRDKVEGPARFGFTVTRKAGGAVERNRMRRRLREALRRAAPLEARPGFDYVIVARRSSLDAGFDQLVSELARALRLVGARKARPGGAGAGSDRSPAP